MKAVEKEGTLTVHDTNHSYYPASLDTHLIFSHSPKFLKPMIMFKQYM